MISIPALPSGFSNALITEILREHGCLPSTGSVSGLTQSLIGDGTGMMAELAKLNLTYDGDQGAAPATVVAKFSSQNPVNRDMAMNYNLYEREARFFAELSPKAGIKTPADLFRWVFRRSVFDPDGRLVRLRGGQPSDWRRFTSDRIGDR